jgi:L-ornithine N5-monooxygenase
MRITLDKGENSVGNDILDILGVGFGPSNLSLAVAIKEHNAKESQKVSSLFLEKKSEGFSWHEQMQFQSVTIQTPFLKDLVTLHNPQSYYSFLNYLKQKGRLFDFVNLHTFFPSRYEFGQYFEWVADQMQDLVCYSNQVTSIEYVHALNVYKVTSLEEGMKEREYLTRNLVIGAGLQPNFPSFITTDNTHVFHSSHFKKALESIASVKKHGADVCVIGAGQSAGEITRHLIQNTNCRVSVYSRGFVFRSIDANPFVNELYGIKSAEWNYGMSDAARKKVASQLATSNYSVIDSDLSNELYQLLYEDKVHEHHRFHLYSFHEVKRLAMDEQVSITFKDLLSEQEKEIKTDFVILATGFTHRNLDDLLKGIDNYIVKEEGNYRYHFDYSLKLIDSHLPNIYLQGYGDDTYGVTEGTLAVLPERSQKILSSILQHQHILV